MEKDEDQKQIDFIVNKWCSLQQIIKEGITLNEISENLKVENKKILCQKYYDYYKNKLETREIIEKTYNIDNGVYKYNSYELLDKKTEDVLADAFIPVEKLFHLLRNDFQYIVQITSLMEENLDHPNIDSIVNLFCHQFYENILIPNPEHEELLILFSLLLEREISNMTTLSISSFIDEYSTILGKFLNSFTKKPDLLNYLSMTLGSIILKVENSGEFFMDINPNKILKNLKKSEMIQECSYFNLELNNKQIGSFISKTTESTVSQIPLFSPLVEKEIEISDFIVPFLKRQRNNSIDTYLIKEFTEKITSEDLIQRIISEKDENMKEFFKIQIERLGRDKDVYTCNQFLESLNQFKEKHIILTNYVNNYEVIKSLIDNIIKSLIANVCTMPYSLRCTCKIICILIQKKFPGISIYERNAFIGEFILGKCILPILVDSDKNGVITSSILSGNIRECLKIASKVLIKISRNLLFDSNVDINFTIFNHYIIEIIPEINNFYNELIKVKLPDILDDIINGDLDYSSITKYEYFDENKEELVNLQCVCFSIEDILTLIEFIKPVLNSMFKPDDSSVKKETLFYKTFQKLIIQKDYLQKVAKNSKKRQFFLTFKDEENPYKKELLTLSQTKFAFFTNQDTTQLILSKIKYCIVVILRELNLINNKVYSFLNQANSNLNFFKGINQTLQIEDYSIDSENEKIPLNWYSIYMISNLSKLEEEFKKNDFLLLYEELFEEENKMIDMLKIKSNLIITKYGMNVRCAETLVQKSKMNLSRSEKICKIIKTKKLIYDCVIEVCITSINDISKPNIEEERFGRTTSIFSFGNLVNKTPKKKSRQKSNCGLNFSNDLNGNIRIVPIDNCIHYYYDNDSSPGSKLSCYSKGKKSTHPNHAETIKEFIHLFGEYQEVRDDILTGKQINNAAKSLSNYLNILQKKMESFELFNHQEEINQYANETVKLNDQLKNNAEAKDNMDRLIKEKNTFLENCKKENIEIIEKIRHFILKRIYIKVYPSKAMPQDLNFYRKTLLLSWITPEHLEIKKIFLNEKLWELAINSLNKMDEERTPQEKINCIANAYGFINRSIKFCSGKDNDSGAEELTPIFQFILIKAQPKRLFSNINYIRGICDASNENDPNKSTREFFLGQIEAAASFVIEITYNHLNISKEEFEKNIEEKTVEIKNVMNKETNISQNNSPKYPTNIQNDKKSY